MDTPAGWRIGDKTVHKFGENQGRQNFAYPANQVLLQESGIIILKQTAQASMVNGSNNHIIKICKSRLSGGCLAIAEIQRFLVVIAAWC